MRKMELKSLDLKSTPPEVLYSTSRIPRRRERRRNRHGNQADLGEVTKLAGLGFVLLWESSRLAARVLGGTCCATLEPVAWGLVRTWIFLSLFVLQAPELAASHEFMPHAYEAS